MSSDAYREHPRVPARQEPAFGYEGPLEAREPEGKTDDLLDRGTEALLAFAIVGPAAVMYALLGYVLYGLLG